MTMKSLPLSLVVLLAACAPLPETIEPIPQSTLVYQEVGCTALYEEEAILLAQLAELSEMQRSNRRRDIALNTFVLVGAGAIARDQTEAIGENKGRLEALWTQNDRCTEFVGEYPQEEED